MTRARIALILTVLIGAVLVPAAPAAADPPSNDLFGGSVVIDPGALPFSDSVDTTEATTDADDLEANDMCGAPATDASVWYSLTPTDDAFAFVTTEGSDYSTGLMVLTGSPGSFELAACGPFELEGPVEGGVTYHLLVFDDQEDGEGTGGNLMLQVDLGEPPPPMCGAPGEELPATIMGAGLIKGTPGDDVIIGSPGPDRILGFGGNDIICGFGGNDVIDGGGGDDLLIGDGQGELPPFAESNGDNDDTLIGGAGDDTLVGLGGDDLMIGNGGNDDIIGMGGEDTAHGGPGDDFIVGGPNDDRLHGEGGDDTIFGAFGSDILNGGAGNDFLNGDNPNEGPPPEFLPFDPGGNDDVCVGGVGVDILENCETEVSA